MEKLMTINLFKKLGFIHIASVASIGISLLIATGANAQEPGVTTAEAVVVTGSNIPTAEEVTASNVDTLSTQDIQRSGVSGDILQILTKVDPDFVGGGNLGSTNANISSGATYGGSIISIRGLPTLVLLDGRRVSDSAAIAAGGFQFTDVSIFPTALISRIEVLKDGASALYGSEAVGGVVNIFLKTDFTGLEFGYRYGFTEQSGVAERRAYAIAGTGNETTHVTAAFQYYEIDPLYLRERGYSQPSFGTTTYFGVGRDRGTGPIPDPNGDRGRVLIVPNLNSPFDAGVVPGSIAPSVNQYLDPGMMGAYATATFNQILTGFDLSKFPTSTLKQRDTDEFASFTHDIFGKQLEVFGDLLYAQNSNFSQLNAQPLSNATGVVILGSLRVNPLNPSGPLIPENRGAPAPWNPFQESIDGFSTAGTNRLTIGNRYLDHPRIFENSSDFYRLLGGLRSQINKDWFTESAFYYSHYTINYVNSNLVDATALNNAIENLGFDFFARNPVGTGPGLVSPAVYDSIFGSNFRKLDSYQKTFDTKIVGFPFELPGGAVGLSVGAEYRLEGFKVQDSPEIFVGSVPIGIIDVGRSVESFYTEVNVPIVGPDMQVPFIYMLNVSAAGRHDHYEGVATDANVPKVTLRYQPIKDLTLRATYSNSFVAPTLYQLYGPVSTGFSPGLSLNGHPQDQAQVITGSNPALLPSTADSYTAGLVYSPSYLPGLTITADWFHTLEQGLVGTIGGQTILQSVESFGPASPYYSLVSFNNFPNHPGAIPVGGPHTLAGNLSAVYYQDTNKNLGAYHVDGFDLSARYVWDLHAWGNLTLGVQSVVFLNQDAKQFPNTNYYNVSGGIGDEGFGFYPDYKVTFLTEYRLWGFTLSANANYIPSMYNELANDITSVSINGGQFPVVKSYFLADAQLSYEFKRTPAPVPAVTSKEAKDTKAVAGGATTAGVFSAYDRLLDGLRLTVGCNNLFQEGPPYIGGANSNTNLVAYDPYGRFIYFEVAHKF
jgi:iron complex outermembrane receptor protein